MKQLRVLYGTFFAVLIMVGGTAIAVENRVTPRNVGGSAAISMVVSAYLFLKFDRY